MRPLKLAKIPIISYNVNKPELSQVKYGEGKP
jgi:hypothetical protein